MKELVCVFQVPDNFEHFEIDGPAIMRGQIEDTAVTIKANPIELPKKMIPNVIDNDYLWMSEGWNAYRKELFKLSKLREK